MSGPLRVSVIGLDTSHATEFTRRLQSPDCEEGLKVDGLRIVTCLRFATPFTDTNTLDERQAQLEEWGVEVTEDFDTAVKDCDALIITINDAAYHLEYFEKCAPLGLPIFLDKPMADTVESADKIIDIAEANGTTFFTASSLRYIDELASAGSAITRPTQVSVYGPLGIAPAGSSIVWYGVHAFEMLEALIGTGAEKVTVVKDKLGALAHVTYNDDRRGLVTLTVGSSQYGGLVRDNDNVYSFVEGSGSRHLFYTRQLEQLVLFFGGGPAPVMVNHSLEIMKLLEATQKSFDSGRPENL